MKKFLKSLVYPLVVIVLLASLVVKAPTPVTSVFATTQCTPVDKYIEKDSDSTSTEVNFDFQDSDKKVVISADSGYTITEVWLDVNGDGVSGYVKYGTGPGTYDPSGNDTITEAKVRVVKSCATPTPTPTQTTNVCPDGNGWTKDEWNDSESSNTYNAPSGKKIVEVCVKVGQLKEFFTVDGEENCWNVDFKNSNSEVKINEDDCDGAGHGEPSISHISYRMEDIATPTNTPTPTIVIPTPTDSVAPTPTPTGSQEPVCEEGQQASYDNNGIRICIDCPGGGTCEVIVGSTPTPTPTDAPVVPTPTPTNAPSSSSTPNTGGTGGASVQGATTEQKQGEVLGATTLAATGDFRSVLATIEQALGVVLITLGVTYGKKKAKKSSK